MVRLAGWAALIMAAPDPPEIWAIATHGISAALGVLGTAIIALITRKPAMLTVVDSSLKTLLDGYREYTAQLVRSHEPQMAEMRKELAGARDEILALEKKLDTLTDELQASRGFGA